MNSASKRRFRLWDRKAIFDSLVHATEIATKIEEKCDEETFPEDLPVSVVPTDMLYYIVVCYKEMYDALLDEDLIKSGNPKFDKTKVN